ncbi:MAG: tetratricopeptide repeat protein [Nitrospinota bacterium]|nr:tetratricopeptide repeat protein [Nitrospinota bacterium]
MAQENKLKRKDLKEPDQFLVASNEFLDFLARNKTSLLVVLVVILAVAGGFLFVSDQRQSQNMKMETLYHQMSRLVGEAKDSPDEDLLSKLKSLYDKFDKGDQKLRAGLILADFQYQNKNYEGALSAFQEVAEGAPAGTLNFNLAQAGIAHSYESKKDFNKAVSHYKKIIDMPGEYPLFHTYLGLARCYELSGDTKNALLILREMQNKFPKHPGLEKVDLTLKRLEGSA